MATQSPLFLPTPYQPQRDPWQMFMQAYLVGIEQRRQKEAFQAELEDRKMRRSLTAAQIKAQEREDALRSRQGDMGLLQFMQQMPGQSFSLPGLQQEAPGMATDLEGGMAPSTQVPLPGPARSVDLPFHDVQTETMGQMRVPSLEATLMRQLQQKQLENALAVQMEGAKAGVKARAEAPFEAAKLQAEQGFKAGESEKERTARAAEGAAGRATTLGVAKMNLQATEANRQLERENKLRDDYERATKDFGIVDDQIARIREFSKAQTGPADIGLLYSYMKMLDPTSTVREGEYATAQNTGSISARLMAAYNKALAGERLSPVQRAEFVAAAETAYASGQGRRGTVLKRYQQAARRQGVDPGIFELPGAGGGGERPRAVNPKTGAVVEWDGQRWVPAQ